MLTELHVKNIALIEEVDLFFENGLNVITGETGAGKSLLMGAVDITLGGKFSPDMIRSGADSALVELVFTTDDEEVISKLREKGYDIEDGEIIISRKLTNGRTVSRINGESCTAAILKETAGQLINIHGQRENQILLKNDRQLGMLDSYARKELTGLKEDVSRHYDEYKKALDEYNKFTMDEEARLREKSMLEYEIKEIEEAALKEGEEEELEKQYRIMKNSRNIVEALGNVHEYTGYDNGAGDLIGRALKEIETVSGYDEVLKDIEASIADVESILDDINRQAAAYLEEFTFSEQEFMDVEARLDKIREIEAKFGADVEKVNKYKDEACERLAFLENYDTDRLKAAEELKNSESRLKEACEALSGKRKTAAKSFAEDIKKQLKELNFAETKLEIAFKKTDSYRRNGTDDIDILISANPGEPVRELSRVASGGEISRIMLAIRNILADEENTGTLIFDEIDTGISGRTAQKVSEKMASIARGHQILCVTHLAQIAAMADSHYLIEKSVDAGKTITNVRRLAKTEETEELARILGGAVITDAVKQNANEMKKLADEYKEKILK
ncbi:MAG: DNA repair protein RecN [Candidatus Alectryocaccobium sp.]|nr:DNA repair protein RecN [Candidatus Alectryocaccobium sp.]